MESYKIENLSFTYPNRTEPTLCDINLSISQGEFITLCGKSGCGKTTLLRLLKTSLAPFGSTDGIILFNNKPLSHVDLKTQASEIGFVVQNPDNQIVTDKVWHELAFGLESLGYSTPEIRTRVSEMASFFGIQTWFYKKVTELSGGQKQLLNLASVMVMQPSVLILDEPTSQLDPIAANEFIKTLEKINRELGTTVILTEHRLEEAFPVSDRVIVMDEGKIIADAVPEAAGKILMDKNHEMYKALPAPMRIYGAMKNSLECPITVREGRLWLERFSENHFIDAGLIPETKSDTDVRNAVIEVKDVWFRYDKKLPDVVKGLNVRVNEGEFFAVVGGNGTGKTTALSLISGLYSPYRGEILINGKKPSGADNIYNGMLGVLPQNPQALFVKKTVFLDLMEMLSGKKISQSEKELNVKRIAAVCRISELLDRHPYDLSGGEQQRAALAKVLLTNPKILLLDEPTKGMDAHFKEIFADILEDLKSKGVTVLMVSHDIEFCARYADRCAMFFDGNITSCGTPREFFAGKNFYTTAANRMARTKLPKAVLAEDVILACGGTVENKKISHTEIKFPEVENTLKENKEKKNKLTPGKIFLGCIFAVLFILTCILQYNKTLDLNKPEIQLISILELAICIACFFPRRSLGIEILKQPQNKRKLTKRTLMAIFLILLAIPLTIYVGMYWMGDRKYYFISLLIIFETLIPFLMVFESRSPATRELIIISVLCAIAVTGRSAFFMLPQFKPMIALIIIAGVCFGGETGFLVGAVAGFVSNFFFGQGPWTPWQMFANGIIGFVAGILFKKGLLRKTRMSLSVFGALSTFVIFGGIMNFATVVLWQPNPTAGMFAPSYILAIPFDLVHSASTAFFLWFTAEPMIEKLERIKIKYGLING